jgi:hypothetical protein
MCVSATHSPTVHTRQRSMQPRIQCSGIVPDTKDPSVLQGRDDLAERIHNGVAAGSAG